MKNDEKITVEYIEKLPKYYQQFIDSVDYLKKLVEFEMDAGKAFRFTMNGLRFDLTSLKDASNDGWHCFHIDGTYVVIHSADQPTELIVPSSFIGGKMKFSVYTKGNSPLAPKIKRITKPKQSWNMNFKDHESIIKQ
eukprot:Pgem_evm1s12794